MKEKLNKIKVIKITHIKYCVEEEDVLDLVDDVDNLKEIENKKKEIIKSLPTSLTLHFDPILEDIVSKDELEEWISNKISDETGWLVDNFSYKIQK